MVIYIYFNVAVTFKNKNKHSDEEYADVDWDSLGFGLMATDYMYITKCCEGQHFEEGQLSRYGNIELSPAAGVLNYGQVCVISNSLLRKLTF